MVSSENDIRNRFLHNPYEKYSCFFNSSKNKRGIGILIKYDLDYEIIETRRSEDENIILLHIRIAGSELCLISIYGPNSVDMGFFNTINNLLTNFANLPVVIGGDFNCTYSTDAVADNIDCLNMSRLPNIAHSEKIAELCERFNISDPYRYINPDIRDFTYAPRSVALLNKSRIDFFLISEQLLEAVSDCKIANSLQNKIFDHKAISLEFNGNIKNTGI
jgi:exonuclease III